MKINFRWKRIITVAAAIYLFYLWMHRDELFYKVNFSLPRFDLFSGNDRVLTAVLWAMFLIFMTGLFKLWVNRRR